MSFKLLAIRPLDGCNEKFLKNLEENKIYKFCNDYSYNFDVKDDIVQINYNQTIIENFFNNNENKSNINISAIVGKNGSGKSAIVEILVASIVKLSLEVNQSFINVSNLYSDYNDSKKINKIKEFEKSLKNDLGNLNVEIFYHYNIFNGNERNRIRRIIIKNNEIRVCDYIDRQKSNKYD
jgi:predicted ATPase